MIIAIASGKGGTGKTTIAASLVQVWENRVAAVDLDVEEPNLHLFLQPEITSQENIFIEIPVLDMTRCTLCGACVDLCQFKAISLLGKNMMIFAEMCHGCGGCLALCPEKALTSGARQLGSVVQGKTNSSDFIMGRLRIGEAMSPPLMRAVKKRLDVLFTGTGIDIIIDAPPGVSCPAVNAVMDADVIVLVTEPTPFGLHDLSLAIDAFAPLGKPLGVVINRAGIGNDDVEIFCKKKTLPILAKIPFERSIAEAYSQGKCISDLSFELHKIFMNLKENILQLKKELPCKR